MSVADIPSVVVRTMGLQAYEQVWRNMQSFTQGRGSDTEDEFWIVSHPPVFTLGQAGKTEHLIAPGDIPVVKSDRGGQVTYHGPGQLIIYLMLNLRRLKLGVRPLVSRMEHSVVELLAYYGVEAETKTNAPGVYVAGDKIASLGLRVRKGCSYHGLSFNLNMDLEPFSRINVCGYEGLKTTQMSALCNSLPGEAEIAGQLVDILSKQLGLRIVTRGGVEGE